jgi:hypothetical protein
VRFSEDTVVLFEVPPELVRDCCETLELVDFELRVNDGLRLTATGRRPGNSCDGEVSLAAEWPFVEPLLVFGLVVDGVLLPPPKKPPFLVEKMPPLLCEPLDVFCILTEGR